MNYYKVLGVDISATQTQIRTAFRKISLETHPDRNGGDPEKTARFKEAQEAHAVLYDEELRRAYDRKAVPPETIGELILKSRAGRTALDLFLPKAPAESACGEDVLIKTYVSRKDLRSGTLIAVKHEGKELRLTIPASTANLMFARVDGRGKPGRNGGRNGDLLIAVVAKN